MAIVFRDIQDQPYILEEHFSQAEITVVSTFRGPWCQFCRAFLKGIRDRHEPFKAADVLFLAVGADTPKDLKKLTEELKLNFPLLSDPGCQAADQLGAPKETNSRFCKQYPGKAFLQPSVTLFDRAGKQVFQWVQKPGILNLGGALFRMDPQAILDEVKKVRV